MTPLTTGTSTNRTRFGAPLAITRRSGVPRPYTPGLVPRSSLLRPHCLAVNRLLEWKPSFKIAALDVSGNPLPALDEELERLPQLFWARLAETTRRTYGSAVLVFNVWADSKNLTDMQRLPASASVMLAFISACAGSYSGSTISGYVAGVKAWHTVHSMPWSCDVSELARAAAGAGATAPETSKRRKRDPYTPGLLQAIRGQLDLTAPLDAAVWACITTAFYGVARLGELTVERKDGCYDATRHPSVSAVRECVADRDGNEVMKRYAISGLRKPMLKLHAGHDYPSPTH